MSAMNAKTFWANRFPLGSHLCRWPMPAMSEMKHDMENLKRHGFNLVKLQEHWAIDEPREGEYDFAVYEELISHAATLEMGVYLGVTCEQAPAWLYRKHPTCRMVGRDGVPISYVAQMTLPADGKVGPCYDHPGAREDQNRFLRKMVSVLGRFENVVVWNVWQEVDYWAEKIVGQPVCYCEHTLNAFRAWLKSYFGDLDALNRAWRTRYAEWIDVEPDRNQLGIALPQSMTWNYFKDNVWIPSVLRNRAEAIRGADPHKRPIFAHRSGPSFGSARDASAAAAVDFWGTSVYPAWTPSFGSRHDALLNEMFTSIVQRFDYTRCSTRRGAPTWGAEFQGGPISTGVHMGRVPDAADIRRWMLGSVAHGATGISFWVTRAEIAAGEMNGFAFLDSEGDSTERFEEASRVGRALDAHAELFASPCVEDAPVAILVNEWNFHLCQVLAESGGELGRSMMGWHRLLWEEGVAADFVMLEDLDSDRLKTYRMLIVPFPLSMSDAVAEKLLAYVRGGGQLMCEAAPGRVDEFTYCPRGGLSPVLRRFFDVDSTGFQRVREPNGEKHWSPTERTWGEYLEPTMLTGCGPLAGLQLRANSHIETYVARGGEVMLRCGDRVAGVVRRADRGSAWLIGTYVGHAGSIGADQSTRACVRKLLAECGVKMDRCGGLLVRRRIRGNQQAWSFFNPSDATVTESIDVSGWAKVVDLLGRAVDRVGDRVSLTVDSLDVRVLIVSR